MKYHHSSGRAKNWPSDPETRVELGYRLRVCRLRLGWSPATAAKNLQVTERTLHNWETGAHRVPWAVYKLLRVLSRYELPGGWSGYRLEGDDLITPEGRSISCHDASWWSLLVRRAHGFDSLYLRLAELERQARAKATARSAGAAHAGLVTSKTTHTGTTDSWCQSDIMMMSCPTPSDSRPGCKPQPEPNPPSWGYPSMRWSASPWTPTSPVRLTLLPGGSSSHPAMLASHRLANPPGPPPEPPGCPGLSAASSPGSKGWPARGHDGHLKQNLGVAHDFWEPRP